jgi:hypothetical protein
MNHHSGRLIDDSEILIFINNVEWDLLSNRLNGIKIGNASGIRCEGYYKRSREIVRQPSAKSETY